MSNAIVVSTNLRENGPDKTGHLEKCFEPLLKLQYKVSSSLDLLS